MTRWLLIALCLGAAACAGGDGGASDTPDAASYQDAIGPAADIANPDGSSMGDAHGGCSVDIEFAANQPTTGDVTATAVVSGVGFGALQSWHVLKQHRDGSSESFPFEPLAQGGIWFRPDED